MSAQLCQFPTMFCCTLFMLYSLFAIPQPSRQYKTFGFHNFEATVLSPYQMIHVNRENAHFVKSYVQKELEAHGLEPSSSPDLYVNITVTLELEDQVLGNFYSSQYHSNSISIYEVGTLSVQLVNIDETRVIWEGSRSMVLWKKKEKKIKKRVDNIVSKIFKGFDPNTLGN